MIFDHPKPQKHPQAIFCNFNFPILPPFFAQGIEQKADEEIEAYQLRAQTMEGQMEKDAQAQAGAIRRIVAAVELLVVGF